MNRFLPSVGMERTTTLELQKDKESMKRIFKGAWSKGNMEVLDKVVAPTFKATSIRSRTTTEEVLEGIESMEKGWIRTRADNRILDKGLKQVREP
jgi:hypothetical protein